MSKIYLNLNRQVLAEEGLKAKTRDEENLGDESKGFLFDECTFVLSDGFEIESNSIKAYGDIIDNHSEKNLGYLDIELDLDLDTVIDIIEIYMKKLGKLKTVLEATK